MTASNTTIHRAAKFLCNPTQDPSPNISGLATTVPESPMGAMLGYLFIPFPQLALLGQSRPFTARLGKLCPPSMADLWLLFHDWPPKGLPARENCPHLSTYYLSRERVPELSLPHYHTDDYLEYHHRIFIRQWIEIETETLIRATD